MVQERKHKGWKILGKKNPPGPQIFIPRFGRKGGKKREKSGVSTWITYLPPWCVIWKFFLFFIFYFILLWELVCLWLVSQVLDSLSFLPFFFLILFFCVRKTPFLFSIVLVFFWIFFFFGSWTSYPLFIYLFFNEEIIHTYFCHKNIMYYCYFT